MNIKFYYCFKFTFKMTRFLYIIRLGYKTLTQLYTGLYNAIQRKCVAQKYKRFYSSWDKLICVNNDAPHYL